jgi:pheromone shutdown protein TraB
MIKLIGTNHLMKKEEIINIIQSENPDIIGIELCKIREYIYINKIKNEPAKDESLLGKISNAIKKKAEEEKVEYGSDMYTALQYSIDNKIPYILVDKNIQEIQTLFQSIPINEQQGFAQEIAKFEKQTIAESTVDEESFLINLKKNFPISFEFLITLRELHIVNQIMRMIVLNPNKKILIFLGKGHIKSINKLLEGII